MFFEKQNGLFVGRFAPLYHDNVWTHGFSTRMGGVSEAPFDSLNLGLNTDDSPDRVHENRKRYFNALGFRAEDAAIPGQVHSDRVEVVTRAGAYPDTDGLVTRTPGVVLVVQTADCLPVFLVDSKNRAAGLVHAGWRGSAQNIGVKALNLMKSHFGTRPESVHIFIGPAIGPCCYEVGDEVKTHFPEAAFQTNRLDLWKANTLQFLEAGVPQSRIEAARLCTRCHRNLFFSHRGSGGKTGRMMAALAINS